MDKIAVGTLNNNCTLTARDKRDEEDIARKDLILKTPGQYRTSAKSADRYFGHWPGANDDFTGRETELAAITAQLQGKGSGVSVIADAPDVGVARGIVGLGGVGKTQLAAEYFHQSLAQQKSGALQSYALQIWLRGSDIELLSADIRRLAVWLGFSYDEKTPLDVVSSQVYQRLAVFSEAAAVRHRPGVLWVVNGADDEAVLKLLPKGDFHKQFDWLITSRHEGMWQNYFAGLRFQSLRLLPFSPTEALRYLRKALTSAVQSKTDCTDINLKTLSENLGYLPLALSLAAAYLNRNINVKSVTAYSRATQDYLKQFARMSATNVNGYERTILITWLIELPVLLENNPKAVELLLACSYLSGESIPWGLLRAYWGDIKSTDETINDDVISHTNLLQDYSLIEPVSNAQGSKSHSISLHPLLQQVVRRWLADDSFVSAPQKIKAWATAITPLLAQHKINRSAVLEKLLSNLRAHSEEQTPTIAGLQRRIELIPQLKAVLSFQSSWPKHKDILTEANLRHQLGLIYLEAQGDALLGRNELEKVLAIEERHYGKDHPETAITLTNLGNAYGDLGDASGQKALLERALAIFERHYGKNHPETAIILTNLGNAYGGLGDASGKKALLERALAIEERHYGRDHPEVAIILTNLGNAYGALGDASRQKALLERALAIKERHYGRGHPHVAITLTSLGNAYGALGDASGKKALLERALAIKERHYGRDHPQTAITLTNLGNAYGDLGDASGQKALLERALAIFERHYGKNHPNVAITLRCLALLHHTQDALTEAADFFRQALSSCPLSAARCDYGLLLMRQNKPEEALAQYKAAILERDIGDLGCHWQRRALLDADLQAEITESGGNFFVSCKLFSLYHQALCYISLNDMTELERAFDNLQAYIEEQHIDADLGQRLLGYAIMQFSDRFDANTHSA